MTKNYKDKLDQYIDDPVLLKLLSTRQKEAKELKDFLDGFIKRLDKASKESLELVKDEDKKDIILDSELVNKNYLNSFYSIIKTIHATEEFLVSKVVNITKGE